jgi:hypothetical protein
MPHIKEKFSQFCDSASRIYIYIKKIHTHIYLYTEGSEGESTRVQTLTASRVKTTYLHVS